MDGITLLTGLDRLNDALYFARKWACGEYELRGFELEYIGQEYGMKRIPRVALSKLGYCTGSTHDGICCDYANWKKGITSAEKWRVTRYLYDLKKKIEEEYS